MPVRSIRPPDSTSSASVGGARGPQLHRRLRPTSRSIATGTAPPTPKTRKWTPPRPIGPLEPVPTGPRTVGERLDDAAPLLIATGACAVVALALRSSPTRIAAGAIEIWILFAALGVIAAVGAFLSLVLDELPDDAPSNAAPSRPSRGVEPGRVPTPVPVRQPVRMPRVPPAPGSPLPRSFRAAPVWLETDGDRERSQSMPPSETYEAVESEPRRRRAPATETAPSEAIAEIDRLWWDLERLRHRGRRGVPA
jgi:hypothetical protein